MQLSINVPHYMAHVYMYVWWGLQVDKPLCTHGIYVQASIHRYARPEVIKKMFFFLFQPRRAGSLSFIQFSSLNFIFGWPPGGCQVVYISKLQ